MPSAEPTPDHSSPLNILLIGGNGREHAMAWKLAASPRIANGGNLYATDTQNPGIADLCRPAGVTFNHKDPYSLQKFCRENHISLVVVGPEEPLANGIADALAHALPGSTACAVFGPVKDAARLEADKAWSKEIMRAASIPTAEGRAFSDYNSAKAYIESRESPQVIKASGLAKGKGVFVPDSMAEGLDALTRIMLAKEFGDAGKTVVIEERLKGREVSVFALVDGRNIMILEPCQDHKRLGDGATGPNTGGMGAVCPSKAIPDSMMAKIQREVLVPVIDTLRRDGIEFRGLLYCGLMLTPGGPKVLEFNVRFGDPETQALLRLMDCDFADLLHATATKRLHEVPLVVSPGVSICVVLAARGYPEKPIPGAVIEGLDEAGAVEGVQVFHAGTRRDESTGKIIVSGGRVLNVTAVGADVDEARKRAYRAVEMIRFDGKTYRTDIGTDTIG